MPTCNARQRAIRTVATTSTCPRSGLTCQCLKYRLAYSWLNSSIRYTFCQNVGVTTWSRWPTAALTSTCCSTRRGGLDTTGRMCGTWSTVKTASPAIKHSQPVRTKTTCHLFKPNPNRCKSFATKREYVNLNCKFELCLERWRGINACECFGCERQWVLKRCLFRL